jgi:Adenine-specific methyltransferase EcoRI
MANENLGAAKKAKNDEFYTQYADIEKEMNAYLEYNPDVFRDKTILLPCDDPAWSNFTKYFAQNFENFGLKKLISTSYAPNSKPKGIPYQPALFELEDERFDELKTQENGKIFTLARDTSGDKRIDVDDLEWSYLEGDGDFRSDEVTKLRDEADIIITNPPFSLFREFLNWIVDAAKSFSIIGNMNAITYKEVFPLIKDNLMWLGNGFHAGNAYFSSPVLKDYADGVFDEVTGLLKFRNVIWMTNIEHGRRHQLLPLMTMEDNIKFSKHKEVRGSAYQKYDNYDAIEVPFTDAIPSDYEGIMGVPISFLDKYSPEQFEIVGNTEGYEGTPPTKVYSKKERVVNGQPMKSNTGTMSGVIRRSTFGLGTYFDVGYPVEAVYKRIFIRHRRTA